MTDLFSIDLPEVRATLKVAGALQPEELSELLGVQGKSYQGPALTRVWEFSTTRERTIDAASHLEAILAVVRPHFREFRGLIFDKSLDVDLKLSIQLAAGESPTGYIDAIRIAELAAMGAGLDIQLGGRD
jgi:hypothetical protein